MGPVEEVTAWPTQRRAGRFRRPAVQLAGFRASGSGRSATTKAITAMAATHRASSAGSSLSSVSPSLW